MKQSQAGVSLVESLLVIVVVGLMVFLLANIPNSLNLIGKSNHLSLAREIAGKQIEDKRATNYANLVSVDSPISDSRLSLLPKGSGTVVVEDCSPSICTNGEHIKQITATINWTETGKPQSISLKTLIGEGGLNQ